jgi:hypothetical protein
MTDLFELIGYQIPPAVNPESPKCDDDDPAYITPPLGKAKPNHEPAPDINVADSGDRPEESLESANQIYIKDRDSLNFADGLLPLARMLTAKDVMEFSDHLDELQGNVIQLCYELNLFLVNDGFITPEIETLQDELKKALPMLTDGDRPNDSPKDENSPENPDKGKSIDDSPTTNGGDRPQKIIGGYIEEKTITTKSGKQHVYLYERWRDNGKLKSKYLGKKISGSRETT